MANKFKNQSTQGVTEELIESFDRLGEEAFVILYGERFLRKFPRNQKIIEKISEAQKKLGISIAYPPSKNAPYFLNRWFSFKEQIFLFSTIFSISIILFLFNRRGVFFKKKLIGITAFFLIYFFYEYIYGPIDGVLILPVGIYKEVDNVASLLSIEPLKKGSYIDFLEAVPAKDPNKEAWVKVRTPEGLIGYVPMNSVRPV